MATMDEYIAQLLAEMLDSPLRGVVRNTFDEPIPETVKKRLLKPLQSGKSRSSPPLRGKKAPVEEFDPTLRISKPWRRSVKEYHVSWNNLTFLTRILIFSIIIVTS